jgi:cell division protein FtsB
MVTEQVISGIEGIAKLTAQNKALRAQVRELREALQMIRELVDTQCIFLEPDEEAQIKQALTRAEGSEEVGK